MLLSLEQKVQKNPEQLASELDGEVVLLSIENGRYYKIDDIGSEVWNRIEEPIKIKQICQDLLNDFDVAKEDCQKDVLAFLEKLKEDNLILVSE
ncbi:MAG: hypothetical protein ACI85I_002556 [Arenicella sp.]|jgi:hypothetical protein